MNALEPTDGYVPPNWVLFVQDIGPAYSLTVLSLFVLLLLYRLAEHLVRRRRESQALRRAPQRVARATPAPVQRLGAAPPVDERPVAHAAARGSAWD